MLPHSIIFIALCCMRYKIYNFVPVIALCCIFDCRIPRTKQDIQARIEKQEAAKRAAHKQQQSRDDNKPGEVNPTPRITLGGPWNRSALFQEESGIIS